MENAKIRSLLKNENNNDDLRFWKRCLQMFPIYHGLCFMMLCTVSYVDHYFEATLIMLGSLTSTAELQD